MGRGKRDCLENYVVKENCNNCADDGANDGNGQTVRPVVVTLTLDRQDSVCNTGAKVSCGVDGVAGQTAQRHTDRDDDTEDQQLTDAGIKVGNLVQAADSEYQNESANNFAEVVKGHVAHGRSSAEDAALGAGILSCIKLILEQNVDEASTNKSTGLLCLQSRLS